MKKEYLSPEIIELIAFRTADVITLSDLIYDDPHDPTIEDWE